MKHRVKVQVWTAQKTSSARHVLPGPQPLPRPARQFRTGRGKGWSAALSSLLLTSATGLVVGGSWLAVQIIVNPASVGWVSWLLPSWDDAIIKPQTLAEIEAEVARAGQRLGQPLHFSTHYSMTPQQAGFHHLLLSVLQPIKHCAPECSQIVELRVYRPKAARTKLAYELIDRMAVTGPTELEVIAPSGTGSTRTLPLTDLSFLDSKAPAGLWLLLSGEWQRGNRVRYGQVLDYDPVRVRLSLLQAWSSPAGQLPQWQQVTGSPTPELVVNQSVGLEPQFQVFQFEASRSLIQPTRLEPISLIAAALNDRSYENSLLLARNGLWSLALARLQAFKQASPWSAAAQAQLDLIALHAEVTQAQADQDWASPTQQVLAQVIDGRWSQSLAKLKSASESGYDIRSLLDTNSDPIWQRVEMALRMNAGQANLQTWGTLMLTVRQNQQQALTWLRKQPQVTPELTRSMLPLLALLNPDSAPDAASNPHSSSPPEIAAQPSLSLVGWVTPLTNLKPQDWTPLTQPNARPGAKLIDFTEPPLRQSWYQIQLKSLQADQNRRKLTLPDVQRPDVSNLERVAQLPLQPLQLGVWQNITQVQSLPLTIKATQIRQGQLWLLGLGEALPSALKPSALVATTPNMSGLQPQASLRLKELMQQPDWQPLLPSLWQALTTARLIPDPTADPLTAIGQWSVQRLALTGHPTPEAVLTLEPDTGSPRTVIFSNQRLLYSDLQWPNQTLIGLIGEANRPMLLLRQGQSLALKQWSAQTQQFEPAALQPLARLPVR